MNNMMIFVVDVLLVWWRIMIRLIEILYNFFLLKKQSTIALRIGILRKLLWIQSPGFAFIKI